MSDKPTLGYWNIRARGDPCRSLLHHLGVEFEEKVYSLEEGPELWFAQKDQVGIQFPNLPYWKDDDVFHSETISILRSICRKYKPEYLGRDLREQGLVDQYAEVIGGNLMKWFMPYFFPEDWAEKKEEGVAAAKEYLYQYEACMKGTKFLCGDEPSYADFFLQWIIKIWKFYDDSMVAEFPKIVEYFATVQALDGIEAANKSQEHLLPFWSGVGWMKSNMPA